MTLFRILPFLAADGGRCPRGWRAAGRGWVVGLAAWAAVPLLGSAPTPSPWQRFGAAVSQRYSIEQTGVNGRPNVIVQLADRQMVVGTDRGLFLYDGRRWQEVRGHSGVHSIEPVADGGFFLGSGSELYELSPDGRGGFESRAMTEGKLRDRPDSIVFALSLVGDTLYGLEGTRIFIAPARGESRVVTLPTWCGDVFELQGHLYLQADSPDHGLLRYVPDDDTFVPAPELLPEVLTESIVANSRDPRGWLWFATRSGRVFRTDGKRSEWVPLDWGDRVDPRAIHAMQALPSGGLAVTTVDQGVVLFDGQGRIVETSSEFGDAARGRVYALGTDRDGGLWLGAALELTRLDSQLTATMFSEPEGLIGEVWAIAQWNDRLYVGTDTGLFVQNLQAAARAEAFVPVPGLGPVKALVESPDGLWISSHQLRLLQPDGTLLDLGPATADPNPILRPRGRRERVLVGSGEGLVVVERRDGEWRVEGRVPGVDRPIFSMAETTDGDVWASLGTGAVIRARPREGGSYEVREFGAESGIPNRWVHFGALGRHLYLGSDQGTLKWDEAADRFVPTTDLIYYGIGEPIGFDPVFNHGEQVWVWPQTTLGTLVPRPPAEALAAMAVSTGHVRARSRAVLRDAAGVHWIGLPTGVLRFEPPATPAVKPQTGEVYLRRLVDLRTGQPLIGGVAEDFALRLSHQQNSFRVEAALPRYGGERFAQFQIQMLGFDETLPAAAASAVREFTNLPAGDYQLVLYASDGSGFAPLPLTVALTVLAPFYATPWAYAAYSLLAAGVVAGIIRWRVAHLDRRAAELQAAVNERTAEITRQSALLHEEKELFASLAAAAPVGIWRGEADGSVILVNAALERICGRTRGRLLQEGWLESVHPDDRSRARELMAACGKDGLAHADELRFQPPDGATRWVFVGLAPVRGAAESNGQWLVGTALDITERRDVERRMMRAQRLESIGTLTGGIAHDLNNALVPIVAGVSLLDDDRAPDRRALLLDIEKSAKRAASMVRQLLAFARGMDGQRVPVELTGLLNELRRILERTFPKNIVLQPEVHVANAWIQGDPTQVHQVLLNFCLNARDAMPQGGSLTVQVASVRVEGAQDAFQEPIPAGPYHVVRVRDTGTGIAPEVLEHIFDPFFTTKEADRGTGLGLSTSLGIIRSHGGYIHVETAVGRGTCFSIYLPQANAPAETTPAAGPEAGAASAQRPVLVLAVDDEAPIRGILQRSLERMRLPVITAPDGAQALQLWSERHAEIGLLAVDLNMPVMDGLTLVRRIRALHPRVPIIAFSGNLAEEQRQELQALQVRWILPKPFRFDEFAAMVRGALSDQPAPPVVAGR